MAFAIRVKTEHAVGISGVAPYFRVMTMGFHHCTLATCLNTVRVRFASWLCLRVGDS